MWKIEAPAYNHHCSNQPSLSNAHHCSNDHSSTSIHPSIHPPLHHPDDGITIPEGYGLQSIPGSTSCSLGSDYTCVCLMLTGMQSSTTLPHLSITEGPSSTHKCHNISDSECLPSVAHQNGREATSCDREYCSPSTFA